MAKYYAYGYSQKESKTYLIDLNSTQRHQAEDEAFTTCQKNNWSYQGVHVVRGTQRQPSTMRKRFANGDPTPTRKGRGKNKGTK